MPTPVCVSVSCIMYTLCMYDECCPVICGSMVQAGDLGMVEYLLDCGASPNPSIIAHTALRAASIFGHEHIARRLLEEQGDPNFCSLFGRTPLMGAAMNTHPALVRVLLEAKVRT